jgi:hypothetical protein
MTSPNTAEPPPTDSSGPEIWPLVIVDLRSRFTYAEHIVEDAEERNRLGIEKYGQPLRASIGRNPLVDAYQEALDLMVYLRQAVEEGHAVGHVYGLALFAGMQLRWMLLTPAERERDVLIQDCINTSEGTDPETVRREAIASVDKYLSKRLAP